jgi:hypothetical protein
VDDPLHIEGALQGCFRFGIKVLASAVGAAPSPQSGIVRFIMIGMHLRGGTNGGKRMVHFDPDHPTLPLGAFHLGFAKPEGLHRHLEPFPPDLTVRVARCQTPLGQILTSQRP